MTPTQKAAMQAALDALEDCRHGCEEPHKTASAVTALRAALAAPVVEPVIDDSIVLAACQKLAPTLFTRGLKPLETDGAHWRKNMHDVEATVRTVLSFVKASPPPPAEVPLLTDGDIRKLADKADEGQEDVEFMLAIARAIEKAVRQKAGLK